MELSDFRSLQGVSDWRALGTGLHAGTGHRSARRYRCPDLDTAAVLAAELVRQLPSEGPLPDLDLRPGSITIRLPQERHDLATPAAAMIAQTVQRLAADYGLEPDPGSQRSVQIAVAHATAVEVRPFWNAIFGYTNHDSGDFQGEDAEDPAHRLPPLWFHKHRTDTSGRGRTHIDVYVPAEKAGDILQAALDAGGQVGDTSDPPHWWTLISPDGHGVDLAPWPDQI